MRWWLVDGGPGMSDKGVWSLFSKQWRAQNRCWNDRSRSVEEEVLSKHPLLLVRSDYKQVSPKFLVFLNSTSAVKSYFKNYTLSFTNKEWVLLSHFSHVWLFVTLWTIAHLAPLSMGFSRQENWSGLHALFQRIFLTQGWNLHLLLLLSWQVGSLPLAPPGECLKSSMPWTRPILWLDWWGHTYSPGPSLLGHQRTHHILTLGALGVHLGVPVSRGREKALKLKFPCLWKESCLGHALVAKEAMREPEENRPGKDNTAHRSLSPSQAGSPWDVRPRIFSCWKHPQCTLWNGFS